MRITPLFFRQLLILVFLLQASSAFAEIFRCVDDDGLTVFKDHKCEEDEELVKTLGETPRLGIVEKNLLLNSSFEAQLSGWNVPKHADWAAGEGVEGGSALVIQAPRPPDDRYIHETVVKQCVKIGNGDKFELKARFRGEGPPLKAYANRANVIWYTSPDCKKGGQWGMYIEPKNVDGWQTISRSNLSPALNAKAAMVTIVQNGRYSNGLKAYWDNISLAPTDVMKTATDDIAEEVMQAYTLPPGKNYIVNGEFRENTSSWRTSGKWSGDEGDVTPGSIRITQKSDRGGYGTSVMSQCVNIGYNTRFDMGASYKRDPTSGQGGGGRLRVSWYEKLNCTGRVRIGGSDDPKKENGWQKLRVNNIEAPENTRSARITMIQSIAGNGSSSVFWDDVFFTSIGRPK